MNLQNTDTLVEQSNSHDHEQINPCLSSIEQSYSKDHEQCSLPPSKRRVGVSDSMVSVCDQSEQKEEATVNVKFSCNDDSDSDSEIEINDKKEDISNYTLLDGDHLDEDTPIKGQEFCLFSFLSPEGIMNCKVRAVKFRGAFSTMDEALKFARELEDKDKYFKIFIGESGKWLDFDPPVNRVEREMSSSKTHQKLLDAQAKQRMEQLNQLAKRHKDNVDKKDKGGKERIEESKKSGAAYDAIDRKKTEKEAKLDKKETDQKQIIDPRKKAKNNAVDRLRKRLAESKNKQVLANMSKDEKTEAMAESEMNKKIRVVGKVSEQLEDKKATLLDVDKNIDNIKRLMAKRKEKVN